MLQSFPHARAASALAAGLLAMAGAALAAPAPATATGLTTPSAIYGVWRNAKDAVHLAIRPCGATATGACGYVVFADDKSQSDARRAGTTNMVGLQVFRNLKQDDDGTWRGRVFAPDIGMTFAGTARLSDPVTLRARGCLISGIVCRSQTWFKIGPAE